MNKKVREAVAKELVLVAKDLVALGGDSKEVANVRKKYKDEWATENKKYTTQWKKLHNDIMNARKEQEIIMRKIRNSGNFLSEKALVNKIKELKVREKDAMIEKGELDKSFHAYNMDNLNSETAEVVELGGTPDMKNNNYRWSEFKNRSRGW
jgi:hypothetical protein